MVIEIALNQGYVALVDEIDLRIVRGINWFVHPSRKTFYVKRNNPGHQAGVSMLHRLIMDPGPGEVVGHINGNGLDNRRCNLRVCSDIENRRNITRLQANNTSGATGVSWCNTCRKWKAYIRVGGKLKTLGSFSDRESAVIARRSIDGSVI